MKLFGKILLAFSFIIIIFIGVSVYSITQTSTLKENSDELNEHGIQPSLTLIKIGQLTENTRVQMVTALAFKNVEATKNALKNLEAITALQQDYAKTASSNEGKEILTEFNNNWALFDERVRKNAELMRAGNWEEATKGIQAGKPLFEAAQASFERLYNQQTIDADTIVQSSDNLLSQYTKVTLILIIITTILAITVAYKFSKQLSQRINVVGVRAQQIANGDLTNEPLVANGKDEIHTLNSSINHMQTSLLKVVNDAADTSQQVSASAEELSATTEESMAATETMANLTQISVQGATSQLTSLTLINDAITELHDNVQSISTSGNQMDALSRQTFEKTQIGASTVKTVNKQIQAIATSSKNTEVAINRLHDKSQEISNIVNMITQIADQTNLLSLNAAIEAARAGEAGKGFAVVADEVRMLADQSRASAEQIYTMITEIQDDIGLVITSIQEESSRVDEGLAKSQQVNVVFSEIEQMVGNVKENAAEINEAIVTINHINERILTNTVEVHSLANDTLQAARNSNESTETQLGSIEEISAAAQSLANLAEHLQAVIRHFKTKA